MTRSNSACIGLLAVLFTASPSLASQGVSPGGTDAITSVEVRCPTFSWATEPGTTAYELVVYAFPTDLADDAVLFADLGIASEVLYEQVAGGAASWTPSGRQCLAAGGRHAWFVRSVTTDEQTGEWSAGRYFSIPAAPSAGEVRQALAVLERWQAANDGDTHSAASTMSRHHDSRPPAGLKSVTTASAAIRGEHPDPSGEAYGVVGVSASAEGAGVAAANTAGGADLVLDGAEDGATDTLLTESGLDRPSADHETFELTNSGPGQLDLEVEGHLRADTVRTEEVVVNGMTVIDDSGDWLGNGSTVPCAGCVRSSDIADGTIFSDDLIDGAITSSKLGAGAVGSSSLRNNAVTSTKIADGTITAADVDPASQIYVSKTQLYIREETSIVSGSQGTWQVEIACDDANDLPLAGSCVVDSSSGILIGGTEDVNWDDPAFAARWMCAFYNRIAASGYPITSRILCISVP